MGARFRFLDFVDVGSGIEEISGQWLLWDYAVLPILLFWVHVKIRRLFAISSGEVSFLLKLLELGLVSYLVGLGLGCVRLLFGVSHSLPDLG